MMHILQASSTTTGYRDRTLLEIALVSAVAMTTRADEVNLFRVQPAGTRLLLERVARADGNGVSCRDTDFESPEIAIPVESREELEACVSGEQSVAVQREADGHFVHCIPVAFDGKIAAVVELIRPAVLSGSELDGIEGFVGLYRNYLSLLEYSERDALTGLPNRRTFDEQVGQIFEHLGAVREPPIAGHGERRELAAAEHPHWIAVVDVDRFKRINDSFGYLYGDEVLILLANLMRESFRHRDHLFRFGGEEFVVILQPAKRENVVGVLERFRERVARHTFPQVGEVTVSIGVAPIRPGDSIPQVLAHADRALFHAKDSGRNRIGDYVELLADGQLQDAGSPRDN